MAATARRTSARKTADNLAIALLFALAALDPSGRAIVLRVAVALYAIHGATHLRRYLGLYYGG